MKKSLLLIALPALLVLSSCVNANGRTNKNNFNYFKEDTVAHEEFFGGSELAPKRIGQPDEDPIQPGGQFTLTPKVGVQFASYTESAQTLYAVRYVAAVDLTSLDGITAEWTRGVSEKDGNQIRSLGGGHLSTVLYDRLNNGGSEKLATSETGGTFKNYLVYSMYGIPDSQIDSYIVAYLTLSDGINTVKSKAIAAKIDGGNAFSFASDTNGYFLEGTIDGTPRTVLSASASDVSFVNAVYNDVTLRTTDSFGSFFFDSSNFKFFGYNSFFDGASDYFNESSLAEYSSPKTAGIQTLYVFGSSAGAENHIHVKNEVTLYLTNNWSWGTPKAYVYNATADTPKVAWSGEAMTLLGLNDNNEFMYNYTVDIGLYDRLKFSNNGSDETQAVDISEANNADAYDLHYVTDHNEATKWGTFNGLTSKKIIYFTNNKGWGSVHYHAFNSATDASEAAWPGNSAKWTANNEYSQGVYRLVVDSSSYDTIIFNNGSGGGSNQTVNIPLSALTGDDNAFYLDGDGSGNYSYGTWKYNDPIFA